MKIIIAGSRDFDDYNLLKHTVSHSIFNGIITEVVSGCAKGADELGEQFAAEFDIPIKRFPADWKKYGKGAGTIRNIQMGRYADGLVVFIRNGSTGSSHMLRVIQNDGKPNVVTRTR